jgi:hypothetical protein
MLVLVVNMVFKKKNPVDYLLRQHRPLVNQFSFTIILFFILSEQKIAEKSTPPVGSSVGVGNIRAR